MPPKPYILSTYEQVNAWTDFQTRTKQDAAYIEGLIRRVPESNLSAEDRDNVNRILSEVLTVKRETLRRLKPELRKARESLAKGAH